MLLQQGWLFIIGECNLQKYDRYSAKNDKPLLKPNGELDENYPKDLYKLKCDIQDGNKSETDLFAEEKVAYLEMRFKKLSRQEKSY